MKSSLNRKIMGAFAATAGLALLAGCHIDMWIQPKVHKPLRDSDFFVDGQSARQPVLGSVARGEFHAASEDPLYKGFEGKRLTDAFPFKLTRDDLKRGQERFNIYCSPCHGRLGYGDGMVAQRGFALRRKPGNYHTERLRKMPVGHFYDVITNGFGTMFSYASRIQDPQDRWRIVGYIRVLQFSQNAPETELPANLDRSQIRPEQPAAEGAAPAPEQR